MNYFFDFGLSRKDLSRGNRWREVRRWFSERLNCQEAVADANEDVRKAEQSIQDDRRKVGCHPVRIGWRNSENQCRTW